MAIKLTTRTKTKPNPNPSVSISSYTDQRTLKNIYQTLNGDKQEDIPFIVWLLENPKSFCKFPRPIDLCRHDYLHILLDRGFSLEDEAFLVGFTMGNDLKTNSLHCLIFKIIPKYLYPKHYRFTDKHLQSFNLGFINGRKVKIKNINNLDFSIYENKKISEIRKILGLDMVIRFD
jgi:hypothetical protein